MSIGNFEFWVNPLEMALWAALMIGRKASIALVTYFVHVVALKYANQKFLDPLLAYCRIP